MNSSRLAEIHRQIAELHRELAVELERDAPANDSTRRRRPVIHSLPKLPIPNELDRKRAREDLQRLGYRARSKP